MFNLPIGFGVVVSLGERDWTNILQEEEEGDAKDFPHQLLLGFLLKLEQKPLLVWRLPVLCLRLVQRVLAQSDSELSFLVSW